jgi:hypothetical protein
MQRNLLRPSDSVVPQEVIENISQRFEHPIPFDIRQMEVVFFFL